MHALHDSVFQCFYTKRREGPQASISRARIGSPRLPASAPTDNNQDRRNLYYLSVPLPHPSTLSNLSFQSRVLFRMPLKICIKPTSTLSDFIKTRRL